MLIIGAKGFAKEVLEVFFQNNEVNTIAFYDDVSNDLPSKLYNQFSIITSEDEAAKFFQETHNQFTIGIGNPVLRKKMAEKFIAIGGVFTSSISPFARIGNFNNTIGKGCNIMTGTIITNDVTINEGVLINLNCTVGHDCTIGAYVELSPGVHISGNCTIGDYSVFGTNATLLPKINVGKNVIVGAGSVVTKDLPDNCIAVGIPAKIIKEVPPLEF
ncbi:acetyltransferase [Flavobacterium sp.]|uniref:acetyltransferase n=1 Tax=Flavobacterium sp. TaxID=239 RepID=UPI00375274DA